MLQVINVEKPLTAAVIIFTAPGGGPNIYMGLTVLIVLLVVVTLLVVFHKWKTGDKINTVFYQHIDIQYCDSPCPPNS